MEFSPDSETISCLFNLFSSLPFEKKAVLFPYSWLNCLRNIFEGLFVLFCEAALGSEVCPYFLIIALSYLEMQQYISIIRSPILFESFSGQFQYFPHKRKLPLFMPYLQPLCS